MTSGTSEIATETETEGTEKESEWTEGTALTAAIETETAVIVTAATATARSPGLATDSATDHGPETAALDNVQQNIDGYNIVSLRMNNNDVQNIVVLF